MQEASESKAHYILAALLGIVGLLILLIFVNLRSQAEEEIIPLTQSPMNTTPTVETIEFRGLNATGAAVTTFSSLGDSTDVTGYVVATVYDPDANATTNLITDEVPTAQMDVVLNLTGSARTDALDAATHVRAALGGSGAATMVANATDPTRATITFPFTLVYYTPPAGDATDGGVYALLSPGYKVYVSATDSSSAESAVPTTGYTVTARVGGSVTGSGAFGTTAIGANSDAIVLTVNNDGNIKAAWTQKRDEWSCTGGKTTDLETRFSGTSGAAYSVMTAVGLTFASSGLTLVADTSAGRLTTTEDLRVNVPIGTKGTCTTTKYFNFADGR